MPDVHDYTTSHARRAAALHLEQLATILDERARKLRTVDAFHRGVIHGFKDAAVVARNYANKLRQLNNQ